MSRVLWRYSLGMIKLLNEKEPLMWSANIEKIDLSILEGTDLRVRDEVYEKIREIISHKDKRKNRNYGICLIEEDLQDLNVYIAAMTKVTTMRRDAKFYISTDSEEIIDEIVEATSFRSEKGDGEIIYSPIIPNYTGDEFAPEEKFIIDYFCLKEMNNIFSTPFNDYAYRVASLARCGVYIPDDNEIYKVDYYDLMKV